MTPFYDMDTRTMYFSSNGHPGLGGLDIFKSTGELRKWEPPKNVGYPINSCTDDLYFTIGKNREEGFLHQTEKAELYLKILLVATIFILIVGQNIYILQLKELHSRTKK